MGTKPIIEADTLYECWMKLNNHLVFKAGDWENDVNDLESPWVLKRDFGLAAYNITLRARKGFGLPEKNLPFFNYDKRLNMLEKRYIDPPLWDEGVQRLINKKAGGKLAAPMTFTILFHRQETSEAKVPTGGGCLVCFNIVNFKKQHRLHITMRASEITCRLLSDMYFFQKMALRVESQVKKVMPKLDMKNIPVDITILLASQVKHYLPPFWLLTEGFDRVKEIMSSEPQNAWQKEVINHFWEDFIYPENITWSQRKKWSEKFYQWCEQMLGDYFDWRAMSHLRGDINHLPEPKKFRGKYKKERPWADKPQLPAKMRKEMEAQSDNLEEADITISIDFGIGQPEQVQLTSTTEEVKRGRGRPKGSKTKPKQGQEPVKQYSFNSSPFRLTF